MLIRLSPALFSYQIFATATSTPSAEFVLSDTKRRGHEVVPPKAVGV
jgi:hypothetical protein